MQKWSFVGAVGAALLVSCATPPAGPPSGDVEAMVREAARTHGVPADLMLAIGEVEGGLRLRATRVVDADDAVPVAGVLELRHGAFDSLARGAALSGATETELEEDLQRGTLAGAMVMSELAHASDVHRATLEGWAPVVERISGMRDSEQRVEYRARVFALLRRGGTLRTRKGTIELAAHPEIPVGLTIAPPVSHTLGTDYPAALDFPTDCTDKCSTSRSGKISMIAIHDTEGGWDASVATLQNDPGKSVHYIVDHDGSRVGQFIPESYDGWHVGNSYYNNRMVGIEHVGFASDDDYPTAMYETSATLVKDIAARNEVPLDRSHIVAHQEVPDGVNIAQDSPPCPDSPGTCVKSPDYGGANHHRDPGIYWEWCQYMELVGGTCKCNDTFELWNCVHNLSMMNRCVNGVVEIQHCAEPCVVEPIGTNDHCVPLVEGTGGATASSSSGMQSTTGAGGAGGGGGDDEGGSCSCRIEDTHGNDAIAFAAVGVAFVTAARRRRRAS